MRIEFDSTKNEINIAKHGLSLTMASELEWDDALIWQDVRHEYIEVRMVALAPRTMTVYFVVYTERGDARRIISLRRANRKEVKRYERET